MTPQEMIDKWAKWEAYQFPQATTKSRLKHLQKEVIEILDSPNDRSEYVDCFALLMLAARSAGFDLSDILIGMDMKLKVNKNRVWGEVNSEGFVEHVRD